MNPRRPLIGLSLCFVLGIAAGLDGSLPPVLLIASAAALLAASFLPLRRGVSMPALYGACALGACLLAALFEGRPSPGYVGAVMDREREYVDVIGVITDEPAPLYGDADGKVRWTFPLRLEGLRRVECWQKVRGRALVEVDGGDVAPGWAYGDRCRWSGLLGPNSEGRWAFKAPFVLRAEASGGAVLSRGHGWALKSWCLRGRRKCSGVLSLGIDDYPEHVGLLQALLLGYRYALPRELREVFSVTGTLHIFAISGLHVGVVALFLAALLKMLGVSRDRWILFLAPALVIYTLGTGMAASALRACVMALLYWSAPLFGRKPDGPSALAAAAVFILAVSPPQLQDPGFILSFLVVAGIMVFYPPLVRRFTGWARGEPWRLPAAAGSPLSDLRATGSKVGASLALTVAAWLASAPLSAYYFNVFSPSALLANLFVIPGSSVIVLTGSLSLVIGSSFPWFAEVMNHANLVFISILMAGVDGVRALPLGHCFVRTPPVLAVMVWYAALLAVRFRRLPGAPAIGCAAAVLGVAFLFPVGSRDDVRIDFLEVGNGAAAFVNLPGPRDLLVDAGPSFHSARVLRHLRREGVDSLAAIVLTHPASDHAGGAVDIMESVRVEELWCSPWKGRAPAYREALRKARELGVRIVRLEQGQSGELAGGVEWEVLHPDARTARKTANEATLVLRLAREQNSILFMGGAEQAVEACLADGPVDPACEVLVAGNQGSRETCSDHWLERVAPRLAIINAGAFNRNGWPDPATVRRIRQHGIGMWRTDRDGDLRVAWSRRGWGQATVVVLAR